IGGLVELVHTSASGRCLCAATSHSHLSMSKGAWHISLYVSSLLNLVLRLSRHFVINLHHNMRTYHPREHHPQDVPSTIPRHLFERGRTLQHIVDERVAMDEAFLDKLTEEF